jgi:alpha-glucosidase/oligosaccharide 4-alpha-D-glucosyltransferase
VGHDLLVHPVLSAGQKKADIYFPASSNWFDFYTGQAYAAGSRQSIDIVREHIPVFVRGGAFIPMAKPLQNTRNIRLRRLIYTTTMTPQLPLLSRSYTMMTV